MRYYPDMTDEYDREEAERLNAKQWQLDLLKCNPDYTCWGPHEDYMCDKDAGWRSPMFFKSWAEFGRPLNDLNEVVNFYFSVERETVRCVACNETGYAPEAQIIADAFYDFEGRGMRWCGAITIDEAQALVQDGRLCTEWNGKKPPTVNQAFVDTVNEANNKCGEGHMLSGLIHDAVNRHILIEQRCKRLGILATCPQCDGHGDSYSAAHAHVELTLWLLHPRKGASRGIEIGMIGERDLPAVFEYLSSAAKRNAQRFARVLKQARKKRAA